MTTGKWNCWWHISSPKPVTWSTFILMLAYSSAAYDQPSQRRLNTYYHASFYNCYYGSFLGKLLESTGMVLKIFVTSSDWETLSRVSEVLPWTRSNRFCNMLPLEKASPNKYDTCDGFEMVGFLEVTLWGLIRPYWVVLLLLSLSFFSAFRYRIPFRYFTRPHTILYKRYSIY